MRKGGVNEGSPAVEHEPGPSAYVRQGSARKTRKAYSERYAISFTSSRWNIPDRAVLGGSERRSEGDVPTACFHFICHPNLTVTQLERRLPVEVAIESCAGGTPAIGGLESCAGGTTASGGASLNSRVCLTLFQV